MRETWVGSLGWEDPLEKGKATHSSILAWRIQRTVYSVGSQSRTWLSNFHFHFSNEPKEKKSSHKIWVDPTEEEKLPKRVKLCILRVPDCAAGKQHFLPSLLWKCNQNWEIRCVEYKIKYISIFLKVPRLSFWCTSFEWMDPQND